VVKEVEEVTFRFVEATKEGERHSNLRESKVIRMKKTRSCESGPDQENEIKELKSI